MSRGAGEFEHFACVYSCDQQFPEMAVPFLEAGLSLREPVLAVTTPANLELVSSAPGRAAPTDYAEPTDFARIQEMAQPAAR